MGEHGAAFIITKACGVLWGVLVYCWGVPDTPLTTRDVLSAYTALRTVQYRIYHTCHLIEKA